MSEPKLYLISVLEDAVESVRTYRDLDLVRKVIQLQDKDNHIHILHCGFVRPELSEKFELPELLKGRLLYSGALKWALPKSFKSTSRPVAVISIEKVDVPCFLALNHWGYELKEEEAKVPRTTSDEYSAPRRDANVKDTITLAALAVLEDGGNSPLNREEIYALIIEKGYYVFNTPQPVHVLDVQLNRYTLGTGYSKAAVDPLFGKTPDAKYFILGNKTGSPSGWVSTLAKEEPELYSQVSKLGVHDEDSYLAVRDSLPEKLQHQIDHKRFDYLLSRIDQNDTRSILRIAPQWLLAREIADLNLTVRAKNVLLAEGVRNVGELAEKTRDQLLKLPNMGRKSMVDLSNAIIKKVQDNSPVSDSDYETKINDDRQAYKETDHKVSDSPPIPEQISRQPLITHLERTIDELGEIDRLVLHGRLGANGKVLTLEQIAEKLGVTRERVRQRQKKYVEKIISTEYWDDVIGDRIGQLLVDREEPLLLEMLDLEADWFKGFDSNFVYLGQTIQMFSENEIRVIDAGGRSVVTRITQNDWDALVKELRPQLKEKASEKIWTRSDISHFLSTCLSEYSARELTPVLHEVLSEHLQYDGESQEAKLITYGKTAESAVEAVLAQAEGPLHYSEITRRASELLGRNVDERTAHNASNKEGVWMFDRGTYGTIDHCPVPESKRLSIRRIVEHMLYQGPINKQWHSKNIIDELAKKYPGIPEELDPYVLRMCIEGSEKLLFLKRMVWARSDSGMKVGDRIETSDSFIQILEEEGRPLSGRELKQRLSEIRGVAEDMQIHGNERLILFGNNVWGLSDWKNEVH